MKGKVFLSSCSQPWNEGDIETSRRLIYVKLSDLWGNLIDSVTIKNTRHLFDCYSGGRNQWVFQRLMMNSLRSARLKEIIVSHVQVDFHSRKQLLRLVLNVCCRLSLGFNMASNIHLKIPIQSHTHVCHNMTWKSIIRRRINIRRRS